MTWAKAAPKPFARRNANGVTRIVRDNYRGTDWWELHRQVKERDGDGCSEPRCVKKGQHLHHNRPLSRGGTTTLSNLCLKCEDHHDDKHPHMAKKRMFLSI